MADKPVPLGPLERMTLYQSRLLIFVEDRPQSNQYRQLMLKPDEFKRVSQVLMEMFPPQEGSGEKNVDPRLSQGVYDLPDLNDIYFNI